MSCPRCNHPGRSDTATTQHKGHVITWCNLCVHTLNLDEEAEKRDQEKMANVLTPLREMPS